MAFRRKIMWSDLLPEIMAKIINDHDLTPIERMRVRWTCSSWRSVATKKHNNKPFTFQPPLLMLLRRTPGGRPELGYFNLLLSSFIDLNLPACLREHRCCGCLDGWLIMVSDTKLELTLFHPISHTQVSLPSQPQCFLGSTYQQPPICRVKKAILSAPPTDSSCMVAAIAGFNIILICRPGQKLWTVFQGALDSAFEDIIFHKGQLFASDSSFKLTSVKLDSRLRGTVALEVQPLPEMHLFRCGRYLAVAGTDLIVVVKSYSYPGMEFRVFKLEGSKWISWKCSSDWCLFIGEVRCEFIPAKDIRGLKANSIYFTSKLIERVAPNGLGIYNFEGHKVEPIRIPSNAGCCSLFEPVWVKPTFS